MGEIVKRLLKYPEVYNLYQSLIGADSYLKKFAHTFLKDDSKQLIKVLDVGCGTSNIVKFFGNNIDYVGFDCSKKYIEYSRKKYPKFSFLNKSVLEKIDTTQDFDVIISLGVMAALNDETLKDMCSILCTYANKNTKFLLADMNYSENASKLEKFLCKNERNSYIRGEQDYINILSQFFNIEKIHHWDKVYRIPYHKVIFECSIKD